jgi:hypothetical protein
MISHFDHPIMRLTASMSDATRPSRGRQIQKSPARLPSRAFCRVKLDSSDGGHFVLATTRLCDPEHAADHGYAAEH